jgi:hypothetical protein
LEQDGQKTIVGGPARAKRASLFTTGATIWGTQPGGPSTFLEIRVALPVHDAKEPRFISKPRYSRLAFLSFDRKRLAQDTLWAISQFGAGKKFVGHDGREYAIVSGIEKPGSESFIDVAVKVDGVEKAVARYGVVLIRISLQ